MLERFLASFNIGLAQGGIALLRTGGWPRRHAVLADQPWHAHAAAPDRLTLQLRTVLSDARCAGRPARIVLADEWVRLFMVTPPHNTGRLQDCQAAAALRFQTLYGASPSDWQLGADWDAQHPFLACAIPQTLLAALRQIAHEQRLKLVSIEPYFVAVWNCWRKKLKADAWLGVVQSETLTLGMIAGARLRAVRVVPLAADAGRDGAWLVAQLEREALRANLAPPDRLQLCGTVPENWLGRITATLHCEQLDAAPLATAPKAAADQRAALSTAMALARAASRA